jgi:alkanesulfonate monooxygenase SsuD/methylene tetrahydromethanopterin reductase-like flavin-dependent oxidoreductase (luciferase family)
MFVDPDRVSSIMHSGTYFTVRGPLNVPRPIQGHPVIALHDSGSEALRTAVLPLIDVLICDLQTSDQAAELRARLQSQSSPSSYLSPALLIKTAMPILGHTEREAWQRADALAALGPSPTAFFVGTPAGLADELRRWLELEACDGFDLRPAVNARDLDLICQAVTLCSPRRRSFEGRSTLRQGLRIARPAGHARQAIS